MRITQLRVQWSSMMGEDEDGRIVELSRYHIHAADANQSHSTANSIDQKEQSTSSSLYSPNTAYANGTTRASDPDATLIALCQLAATRLDALVVGISLLGRHGQYNLADSTQPLELDAAGTAGAPENAIWLAISQGHWHHDLCQRTIRTTEGKDVSVPLCSISDMNADANLGALPYVKGEPYLKSFWGTPVRTANGYKIGVLWMLDDKVRAELTGDHIRFIGTITSLVMQNLESRRESIERRKIMRMAKAIDNFVDGGHGYHNLSNQSPSKFDASHVGHKADDSGDLDRSIGEVLPQLPQDPATTMPCATENSPTTGRRRGCNTIMSNAGPQAESEIIDSKDKHDQDLVYARASHLIRESLAVQGCLFLDASTGFMAREDDSKRPGSSTTEGHGLRTGSYSDLADRTSKNPQERPSRPGRRSLLAAPHPGMSSSSVPNAEVLGFALEGSSSLCGGQPETVDQFPFLGEDFLLLLTKKYSRGTIWFFREDGSLFTSTDGEAADACSISNSDSPLQKNGHEPRKIEAIKLQTAIPRARQILFVPLLEAESSRAIAGCFAFTTDFTRILSAEAELGFFKSFVNNVGAQVARINAIAADRSKNAFIGSISHELRSPLHGILAAAEFLEDTKIDTYQKSLINTQVSCGKTLLQVIEHVLDYAKINSFEKDEQAASLHGERFSSDHIHFGSKMQNLCVNTDIAELCEEVIEGSVAGKSHMQSDAGVNGSSAEAFARRDQGESLSKPEAIQEHKLGFSQNVAVTLDFDYQRNWTYVTQPGALRRILMNVLGNSLKYTASGCICVRLGVQDLNDPSGEVSSIMSLSVSDTGRGISHDFLRKKLFTPFFQEDYLSTGCGLGLSIVKSLVKTLKGNLEVQSEQRIGTTVLIEVPLSRADQNHSAEHSTPLIKPAEAENLCLPNEGLTVGFVGFQPEGEVRSPVFEGREGIIKETIRKSVARCMIDWLQMEPLPDVHIHDADYVMILVDERVTSFIRPYIEDVQRQQPRVIALLASEMSRRAVEHVLGQTIHAFEVVSAPFGPRKMARAVAACEKAAARWTGHYRRPPPLTTVEKLKAVETDLDVGSYLLKCNDVVVRPKSDHSHAPSGVHLVNGMRIADTPSNPQRMEEPHKMEDTTKAEEPPKVGSQCETAPQLTSSLQDSSQSLRFLLVDDNAINLRLLETFVRKSNWNYSRAENGLLAVQAFENAQKEQGTGYGIIFMDISMPVMDGLEATREIRRLEQKQRERCDKERNEETTASLSPQPPTPALIVALTGLANSQDQRSAFESGVDFFMTKPAKFKEISKLLDGWFGQRKEINAVAQEEAYRQQPQWTMSKN